MTRTEAEREVERLNREHPERATYRWMVRSDDEGDCSIVRVPVPPGRKADPLKATTEGRPKPAQADNPRTDLGRIPYHGV